MDNFIRFFLKPTSHVSFSNLKYNFFITRQSWQLISTTLNGHVHLSSFFFTIFLSLLRITFHVHLVWASQTMLISRLLYWVSFGSCIFMSHYSDHASDRSHYWLCFWSCVSIIFKLTFSDNGSCQEPSVLIIQAACISFVPHLIWTYFPSMSYFFSSNSSCFQVYTLSLKSDVKDIKAHP